MAATYDAIAEPFAVSRQKPWSELGSLKTLIQSVVKTQNFASLLDVGCGNGRVAEIAQQCKVEYTGLDVSEKLIQLAREKYPNESFVVGSMLNLPFLDEQFDIVIAIASLQHIPSQKLRLQTLKELYRVTKPNGILFMLNWNLYQPRWEKYFVQDSAYDPGDALIPWKDSQGKILAQRYYHGFKLDELKQLLQASGWQLTEQYYSKHNIVTVANKPSCQNLSLSV